MPDGDHHHEEWRPSHNPWLITVSVMLATVMEILDTTIVNVSLPHIAGSLSATSEEATWVLTSYLISNAVILAAAGWLSRYFGRKRYLAFSVSLFVISSIFCGMARNLSQIIIARILQGVGGGGLQPLSNAILLESFPKEKRGEAMAAYGMGVVVAPVIGPVLGGWITDNYSWRWLFYINVPIGLIGLFMQEMFIEDPPYVQRQRDGKIDYWGFGLLTLGIALLQVILDKGQELDWFSSPLIVWSTGLSAVALGAWVLWELYSPDPLVNLRLLKDRNFALATWLMALLGSILYGTTVILPLFMQLLLGYTAYDAGWAMMPRGLGSFLSMMIIGRLMRLKGVDSRVLLLLGFAGVGATCWVLGGLNLNVARSNIAGPLLVNGMAMGFIFVPMTVLAYSTLKQSQIYQATGLYSLLRNLGASIGISMCVTFQQRLAQAHQNFLAAHITPFTGAFHAAMNRLGAALHSITLTPSFPLARHMVYQALIGQSLLLSYMDVFEGLAIASGVASLFVLLFHKARHAGRPLPVD